MRPHHPILILILVFILMVACTPKGDNGMLETRRGTSLQTTPSPELSAVDSLMWQRPDSALVCLLPYFDTCCRDVSRNVSETANDGISGDVSENVSTDYNRHYAHLLLAELFYKNDYAQTNRVELRQAVGYFDSLLMADTRGVSLHGSGHRDASHASAKNVSATTAFLDARAHYINGVGYYEHDSVVEACEEYLKALQVMEEHFEEKELVGEKAKFIAYTFTRLTDLFSDLYLHKQAIYFAQLSIPYYKQEAPSWHIARMLNEIGSQYDMIQQTDTAKYYYQKAIEVLNDTTVLLYRDIAAHIVYLDYKKGFCDSDAAIMKLQRLASNSESDRERLSFLISVGEIFYHEKKHDSAWRYLDTVFKASSVVGLKKQAAEWLVEISKKEGKNSEILEFAEYLVPFANTEENKSEIKSQLTELYNTFLQSKTELKHRNELKRGSRLATAIVGSLIVIVLVTTILFHRNKKKKQHLEELIESERYAHKIQQAALAGKLKQSNAAMKVHNNTIYPIQTIEKTHDSSADDYTEEPISLHILSVCNDEKNPIKSTIPISAYAEIALTDIQKAQLKEAAWRHYGQLFETLRQQHPELKDKDFLYCYLCLLGLDNVQIAALLQNSQSTIWDREKRLQRVFDSKEKVAIILRGFLINCKSGC